jgi:hypothetical protein
MPAIYIRFICAMLKGREAREQTLDRYQAAAVVFSHSPQHGGQAMKSKPWRILYYS